MRRQCFAAFVGSLIGIILTCTPFSRADEKTQKNIRTQKDERWKPVEAKEKFQNYRISPLPRNADQSSRSGYQPKNLNTDTSFPTREHRTWALFFGTGWTKEKLGEIQDQIQRRQLINPFTGNPFDPSDTKVFAFSQKNPLGEATRVVTDHLEIHILSSHEELKGYHFDFGICHSNACPNALDAHKAGIMKVDVFLALGTDWTSKDFRPGDLKGTKLFFFATSGDPIWKIPAPNWARITEDTPGFKFSIPFDRPQEIMKGIRNLFTRGRADTDSYPVIRLDPPPGQEGTLSKPFRPHAIFDSYFKAVGPWMRSEGKQQKELTEKVRQVEASAYRDDQKKVLPFPPCPGCGPGGGGASGVGNISQGKGSGILPSTPRVHDRGGISAEIVIDQKDFRSK